MRGISAWEVAGVGSTSTRGSQCRVTVGIECGGQWVPRGQPRGRNQEYPCRVVMRGGGGGYCMLFGRPLREWVIDRGEEIGGLDRYSVVNGVAA